MIVIIRLLEDDNDYYDDGHYYDDGYDCDDEDNADYTMMAMAIVMEYNDGNNDNDDDGRDGGYCDDDGRQ